MQAQIISIKKYFKTTFIYHALLSLFLFATMLNTYHDMEIKNESSQDLFFVKTALPALDTIYTTEFALETYIDNITGILIKSPLSYIHTAMPFTKMLPIQFKSGGIVSFFTLPEVHEMINLDKNNEFTPSFLEPEAHEVNTELLNNYKHLLAEYYSGDTSLEVDEELLEYLGFDFEKMAHQPLNINTDVDGPHVLIFHTHAFELYEGEENGYYADNGVVKVGEELKRVLESKYGLEVMHVKTMFTPTVTNAYEETEKVIETIIDINPSLQLAIDIHRDGLQPGSAKVVAEFNGQDTAKLMFVNGLSLKRTMSGDIVPHKSLDNPYLQDNLTLSLQAYIQGLTYYPELMRKNFLKSYRYSTHMLPYSMLIEVGFNNNTRQEALNTVEPLADIIGKVFELKEK
ncbi:MAG: hypothetical protein ATN31_00300 [Candidatus Epulonipiscioides saccharophilum]|nr:MAG: hypothetical protein ATN31_00300 [Epulopiscium sp. AS2M-Bin001]